MILLNKIILNIKIFITLNYIYPRSARYKKIRSIISKNVIVGNDVVIDEDVDLSQNILAIPDGVYIGRRTQISACDKIGKYTSISSDVKIGLISHPSDYISTSPLFYNKRRGFVNSNTYNEINKGYSSIGNDVLISSNAIVLAGVQIGDGAIVGAGAFVNKNVPPYAVVAGVPAKILRYRFSEDTIKRLLEIKWWDLSRDELLKYEAYFNSGDEFVANYFK